MGNPLKSNKRTSPLKAAAIAAAPSALELGSGYEILHRGSAFPEDFVSRDMSFSQSYGAVPSALSYTLGETSSLNDEANLDKNYWTSKVEGFEDNSENALSAEKKKTPAWKKAGLLFLLAPKGSLIFAPVILKKIMGGSAISLSGP